MTRRTDGSTWIQRAGWAVILPIVCIAGSYSGGCVHAESTPAAPTHYEELTKDEWRQWVSDNYNERFNGRNLKITGRYREMPVPGLGDKILFMIMPASEGDMRGGLRPIGVQAPKSMRDELLKLRGGDMISVYGRARRLSGPPFDRLEFNVQRIEVLP